MAAVVLARFKVQDYEQWRQAFESNIELRKGGGCSGTHVFRNAADANDVTVNFQWDSEENARSFLASPAFARARDGAGVLASSFDYWVVEDAGRTSS